MEQSSSHNFSLTQKNKMYPINEKTQTFQITILNNKNQHQPNIPKTTEITIITTPMSIKAISRKLGLKEKNAATAPTNKITAPSKNARSEATLALDF
jgi:hypothetical protein